MQAVMDYEELPLRTGDVVRYDNHWSASGASGVVVERVGADCVRVFWNDSSRTTTHRCFSLKKQSEQGPAHDQ